MFSIASVCGSQFAAGAFIHTKRHEAILILEGIEQYQFVFVTQRVENTHSFFANGSGWNHK